MGYITKKELMEKLSTESLFSYDQLSLIDEYILIDKIYDDTKLDSKAIETFAKEGILKLFYTFCKKHYFFPQWLKNVDEGKESLN